MSISNLYPGGDNPVTVNLGLALYDMSYEMAENFIILDAAIGSGSSVRINSAVIPNVNFVNSATVTFSVVGSNVSAMAASGGAAWASLTGDLTETQVIPWDGGTVGTPDTGISRTAPGRLALGNGTAGNASGELSLLAVVGENSASTLYFSNDPAFASGFSVSLSPVTAFIGMSSGSFIPGTVWDSTSGYIRNSLGAPGVGFQIVAPNNDTIFIYPDLSGGELLFEQAGIGTGQLIFNAASTTGLISLACGNNGTSFTGAILFSLGTSSGTPTIVNPASGNPVLTWPSTTGTLALLTDNNPSGTVIGWNSDSGVSRLAAASLAIGNGTAGNTSGNLSLNRVNVAGADYAGQATVTAGQTTKAVSFAVAYAGTGQPVVVVTPTSDPLVAGVPVGIWVTYSGGAGAWTGFTINLQLALASNLTMNYVVIGVA